MISEIPKIKFVKGIPGLDYLENSFVILDDLMNEVIEDKSFLKLFTVNSHHRKVSVIFENLYFLILRSISLNAHYLIIFKNRKRWKILYISL